MRVIDLQRHQLLNPNEMDSMFVDCERTSLPFREMTGRRLSCWPSESRTGFGHRPIQTRDLSLFSVQRSAQLGTNIPADGVSLEGHQEQQPPAAHFRHAPTHIVLFLVGIVHPPLVLDD